MAPLLPSALAAATAVSVTAVAAGLPPPPPALPALPPQPTRAMAALALLCPVRVPALRAGRTVNRARPANLEAELAQFTGQVHASGCTHCAGGSGVWSACVVAPGFFGGSCANCHYGSEGSRCSLRRAPQPNVLPAAAAANPNLLSRPVRRVAPVRPIVDRVTPGINALPRPSRPRAAAAAAATAAAPRRGPRLTPSQRARRLAELYRGLAALYEEEAEVLEEEEGTDWSVPETEEEGEREESVEL